MTDLISKFVNILVDTVVGVTESANPPHTSPEIVETFDAFSQNSLKLENISGNVTVKGVEGDQITVRYHKVCSAVSQGSAEEIFRKARVEIQRNGDELLVRTVYDQQLRMFRNSPSVVYDVELPRSVLAFVKNTHGNIVLEGVHSNIEAATVNGGVDAKDCGGRVTLSSENGALNVVGVSSHVTLTTTNGSINARDLEVKDFRANCINGNISAHLALKPYGVVAAETINGDIDLCFPPGADAQVSFGTVNGRTSISMQSNPNATSRISANTVNGGIKVRNV